MTYCAQCGKEVPINANYCCYCGAAQQKGATEEFSISSDELVKTVKHLLHEGNVRRILVKDDKNQTLLDIPVTIGVVGVILAPWLAALGVIAAMVTHCHLVVERRDGT